MPITTIAQWDGTTPANNTDLNSITLLENQTLPSHVNGLIRELMKQVKAGVSANTLMAAYTAASASGPASLDLFEDTDNGTNKVRVTVAASIASDVTLTLPSATDTLVGKATTDTLTNKTLTNPTITGTTTNDSAAAGVVGECVESNVLAASSITLTTATAANVGSISLTAGDWEVCIVTYFECATSTSLTQTADSISQTTATLNLASPNFCLNNYAAFVPGNGAVQTISIPPIRVSLSGTTTIYHVCRASFTADTLKAYGMIHARRVR